MTATSLEDQLFGVRLSIRYHARRVMFYDRWNALVTGASALFASAASVTLLTSVDPKWAALIAAVVAFLQVADLVVGTSRLARTHDQIYRRFIELEKRINLLSPNATTQDILTITNERLSIEADEPPTLRNLTLMCRNELLRAEGYRIEEAGHSFTTSQSLLAPYFDLGEAMANHREPQAIS